MSEQRGWLSYTAPATAEAGPAAEGCWSTSLALCSWVQHCALTLCAHLCWPLLALRSRAVSCTLHPAVLARIGGCTQVGCMVASRHNVGNDSFRDRDRDSWPPLTEADRLHLAARRRERLQDIVMKTCGPLLKTAMQHHVSMHLWQLGAGGWGVGWRMGVRAVL